MFRLIHSIRDEEQGGSIAEFALTTLLLVPMVIYTIYSGEAFVAAIKAQEAEIHAGWEITAYLTHSYNGGPSPTERLTSAATKSADRVKGELKDFDSFNNTGSRVGYLGVFGLNTLDDLKCEPRSVGVDFGPKVVAKDYLHADGWVGCKANVSYENKRAPTDAHLEFFNGTPKIISSSIAKLEMCGSGTKLRGCEPADTRGFVVFTDDWGLENPAAEKVGDYGGGNPEYWNVGADMYKYGTDAPQAVLKAMFVLMVGTPDEKGETDKFKMGYMETVDTKRDFASHTGNASLHLSISHEEPSEANTNDEDLSTRSYADQRTKDSYLAMPDPEWNEP
ncbi:MAG: hypothetical protein HY901_06665 [Deltaproteobacteria bacterium]|nr:hypothetical protein [Deltaproteobacteria bacterium]